MTSPIYRPMHKVRLRNFDIYSIDGEVAVDHVIRYEMIDEELQTVMDRLGVKETPELSHRKTQFRKKKRNYREYYDEETRALVEKWYSDEISALGYTF